MAKPRCDRHKRSLPYCDACKEAVRVAEEAALQVEQDALAEISESERRLEGADKEDAREEESKALKEGVGFPGAADEESPASSPPADDVGEGPHVGMPEEPSDWDGAIDQAEETFREGATIDETESKMAEEGEFDIVPHPGGDAEAGEFEFPNMGDGVPTDPPLAVITQLNEIVKALESDEPVTVLIGENAEEDIRREGRKDVIRMVREYYSDSIDTNAFQLLAYLEKACK